MSSNPQTPAVNPATMGKNTLFDYTHNTSQFKVFSRVVDAAGFADQLKKPGAYTVFAPTDEAFSRLPQGTLENWLKDENRGRLAKVIGQHIVSDKVTPEAVTAHRVANNLAGQPAPLEIDHGTLMLGEAHVVNPEPAKCSNGLVYAIDKVNLPPS